MRFCRRKERSCCNGQRPNPSTEIPISFPMAGKPIAQPIPINAQTPIEQLYLQGVFLEKTENQLGALKLFDRVLAQDSGYVPALMKEAWYSYSAADFKKAESLIARAAERDTEDPYIAYTHGVIDRADGRYSLANDALWSAIHYGAAMRAGANPGRLLCGVGRDCASPV